MVEKVKQIKIDEDLFRMIYQYFIYGREDETELIKAGLKDKMDKMILRNIYTESKMPNQQRREKMQEKNILTERKSRRISVGKFLLNVNDLQVALAGCRADKSATIYAVATKKLKVKGKQISPRRLRAKYTHRTKSYDFMLLRVYISPLQGAFYFT